jgi:pyridoxamine 5'-phosphate oxidase
MVNTNLASLINKFNIWLDEAKNCPQISEPTAMCLATISTDMQPLARMVLLKQVNEQGFYFFTNQNSQKGQDLQNNKKVALCFYWEQIKKQIRIAGFVKQATSQESDTYFASRPYQSKIGAWASAQSKPMQNWQEFEKKIQYFSDKFHQQPVPRPNFWSGFIVVPTQIEFWQEQDFRLHHRFLYTKQSNDSWQGQQLYP